MLLCLSILHISTQNLSSFWTSTIALTQHCHCSSVSTALGRNYTAIHKTQWVTSLNIVHCCHWVREGCHTLLLLCNTILLKTVSQIPQIFHTCFHPTLLDNMCSCTFICQVLCVIIFAQRRDPHTLPPAVKVQALTQQLSLCEQS